MKTPIEPSDIRAGDLVREEYAEAWLTDHGTERFAVEYRATHDRHTLALSHVSGHFLLDRPKPDVELPTVTTLGWAVGVADPTPLLAVWLLQRADTLYSMRAPDLAAEKVTSFTPATAVPTEALNAVRHEARCSSDFHTREKLTAFLAAVDKANS